ncbi:cytochrome c oxidase assembly protein [Sphaerisporangium sp. NPDC051017]|uniref:cytochrome c oxidase assembly protein n=1 Tax=Sphaerisporangium sp. NPDC051017 TaxID=3154636 RepID=UPI00343A9ED3
MRQRARVGLVHRVRGLTVHGTHDGGTWASACSVAALLAVYLLAASARRREARGWSGWRTAAFATGAALLAAGLSPPVAALGHDLRGHMLQHLLIGMLAPVGLVLGAPVTLLLRTLPPPGRRALGRALASRAAHVLTGPWVALVLSVGGMAALYCTPLYGLVTGDPALCHLLHAHFLLAGCLFAWAMAGPDPAPRRPSVPHRLVVLGVAVAAHATVAQLMYAGLLTGLTAPGRELRGAAELMYYGGDAAEVLLALAMVTTWRPARRRAPALQAS